MMRAHKYTPLFLLELLVSLTLFAFSAAVCLQLFAASRRIGQESRALSGAVLAAQNTAEVLKSKNGDTDAAADFLQGEKTQTGFVLCFDADWEPAAPDAAVYVLRCTAHQDGALVRAQIEVEDLIDLTVVCRKGEQP